MAYNDGSVPSVWPSAFLACLDCLCAAFTAFILAAEENNIPLVRVPVPFFILFSLSLSSSQCQWAA